MLLLNDPRWSSHPHALGTLHWISSVEGVLPTHLDETDLSTWATQQNGNWAAILESEDALHLIIDVPRSFPLHYSQCNGQWLVSNDVNALIDFLPGVTANLAVMEEFHNIGNVFGNDTLLNEVKTARAFSITSLFHDGSVQEAPHTVYFDEPEYERMTDIDAFFKVFLNTLRERFRMLIDTANGQQIAVPLSGGADSRLLLGLLKELEAPNVITLTYGKPHSQEAQVSKQVAQACGFPWLFVEIDDNAMHRDWNSSSTADFLQATWSGNALPHIQDWYALKLLTESGDLHPNAIVLPGHTIVGNEHDESILAREEGLSREEMGKLLARKHYLLTGHPDRYVRDVHFQKAINDYLDLVGYTQGKSNLYEVTAILNLLERQAKYINNSMRSYEYFGLQWALPMIEAPLVHLWHRVAPLAVRDVPRSHYIRFTNEYFSSVTGIDLDFFAGPLSSESSTLINLLRKTTDILHLRNRLNNLYRARVELNHPMGFHNLFYNLPPTTLRKRLIRGEHILGVYADQFLRNNWAPNCHLIPQTKK